MKKKLALIFAILVLSQTLFSCSDTSEDTTLSETASSMAETGGTAGEESTETIADEETRQMHAVPSDLDYGGETFTIVYPNWQGYNYYFFANECSWLIKKYKNKARTERPAAIPYSRGQIAEQTAFVNGQDARRICAAVDKCRPFHFCSR